MKRCVQIINGFDSVMHSNVRFDPCRAFVRAYLHIRWFQPRFDSFCSPTKINGYKYIIVSAGQTRAS